MSDKKVYLTKTSLTWIFILSFIFSLLVMTSMHNFNYGISIGWIQNDPKLVSSKAELNNQIKLPPKEDEETFLKQKFDKQEWISKEDSEIFKNNFSIKKILKREAISFTEIRLSSVTLVLRHYCNTVTMTLVWWCRNTKVTLHQI